MQHPLKLRLGQCTCDVCTSVHRCIPISIQRTSDKGLPSGFAAVIRADTEDQCDLGPEGWTEEECFAATISFLTDGPRDNWLTLPSWPDPAQTRFLIRDTLQAFNEWDYSTFRREAELAASRIDNLWGLA